MVAVIMVVVVGYFRIVVVYADNLISYQNFVYSFNKLIKESRFKNYLKINK